MKTQKVYKCPLCEQGLLGNSGVVAHFRARHKTEYFNLMSVSRTNGVAVSEALNEIFLKQQVDNLTEHAEKFPNLNGADWKQLSDTLCLRMEERAKTLRDEIAGIDAKRQELAVIEEIAKNLREKVSQL